MRHRVLPPAGALLLAAAFLAGCGSSSTPTPGASYSRADRTGAPGVSMVLITTDAQRDKFNAGDPPDDARTDSAAVVNGIGWQAAELVRVHDLRVAAAGVLPPDDTLSEASTVALLNPDVLTLDLTKPDGFPNGRRPQDDVMDLVLGAVYARGRPLSGGPGLSDGIPSNDVPFLSTFPYLAEPHMSTP